MSKPKAPATPDYAAAAKEQGVANLNAALGTNYLNQVDQTGPYGSQKYTYSTYDPGQKATPYQAAMYDSKGRLIRPEVQAVEGREANLNGGQLLPDGTYIPRTTLATTLSPEQQKLYEQNTTIGTNLNDLAIRGIGYVDQATENPLTAGQFRDISYAPDSQKVGSDGRLMYQYDFSNLGAMPSSSDFGDQRDQVTQALFERMNPQIQQDRDALATRLANQGISLGSTAYGDANFNQDRGINDARLAAVLAGSQEQQRLFENAMGIRQQGVNEAVSQGNFNNSAVGQSFNQNLQSNQNYFNQGLASSQFNNQALAQAIQQADYFQNQPLNMLNALRSGNQVTTPQFGQANTGTQIQAAPIYQATADQATAEQQAYQNSMSGFGSLLGGLGTLGGAAITKYSDRRLKTDIEKLGQTRSGLGLYSFRYIETDEIDFGYMADEVEKIFPDAVTYDERGYAMVDYGKVH